MFLLTRLWTNKDQGSGRAVQDSRNGGMLLLIPIEANDERIEIIRTRRVPEINSFQPSMRFAMEGAVSAGAVKDLFTNSPHRGARNQLQ